MKKTLLLLIILIFIVSCTSKINSKNIINETPIQQSSELNHENDQFYSSKQVVTNIIEKTIHPHPEEEISIPIESLTEYEKEETTTQVNNEPNSQLTNTNEQPIQSEVSEPEQPSSPIQDQSTEFSVTETPHKVICSNAWYDENQPCDWIPYNLKPVDELRRSVPSFPTSQEAWDWGEAQMTESTSIWYLCGFNRMDGETNDGTPFYYAYMKSCPSD